MTTNEPALDLRGLHKTFSTPAGPVHAVDGLDLTVHQGEVVAFLGPNGAGKTTTIDLILGLAVPDTGSVRVLGGDPVRAIQQGRVSAVMQTGGLLKDLTVRETLELTASFFGAPAAVGTSTTCWGTHSRSSPSRPSWPGVSSSRTLRAHAGRSSRSRRWRGPRWRTCGRW